MNEITGKQYHLREKQSIRGDFVGHCTSGVGEIRIHSLKKNAPSQIIYTNPPFNSEKCRQIKET